jgi:ribosomal protein S2
MKIDRTTSFKNKLLHLKLIKTQTYKLLNPFESIKIENVEFRLKKALQVIYKYHTSDKQILFIGTPLKLNKKLNSLLKNTKHTIIPEPLWVNGAIINIKNRLSNSNPKISKLLLKLKRTPDLIVILNKTSNTTALEEAYKTRIIAVSLSCNLTGDESTYKTQGYFKLIQKQIRHNLFYILLVSVLKKSNKK